jgi:ABC-type polar amino acid transport system ATPase subunit
MGRSLAFGISNGFLVRVDIAGKGGGMIDVCDLVKRHGSLEVLRGVSLQVPRGEVAVIIGPSGGGKSTFLRCLNGLEPFDGGSVTIDGLRLDMERPAPARDAVLRQIRLRVGMVFQSFNLFPHRTVLQNVTEAPVHVLGLDRAQAEERARRLLDRVGLADKLHAMPRQLSGGQQQRVAIARTLAMEPQAILFDEPTSSLDPRMTVEVLTVISDLARDGQTMIVVTHAIKFARQVAKSVYVLGNGRVIESGPPEQVIDHPREEATRLLLAEVQAA